MADVEMTPVEMTPVAPEPPKTNPLKPTAVLKPGLKLPPKPAPLGAGLKLPPKPAPLGAGLKLPPKPGATIIAKPMIRKPGAPGALGAAKPLPKPVLPKPAVPAPAASAPAAAAPAPEVKTVDNPVATPFTKAVETAVPPPPPPPPAAPQAPAAPAMEQLKAVTQKLKGVTQQIPAQAILHKTGIIADSAQSEAQKEAAKHKTARISLNEAIGAAPVKSEPAPMKTIRIKRPIDIASKAPSSAAATEGNPAEAPATPQAAAPAGETSVTQKKTLKIQRPGSAVRPGAPKMTLKKPGAPAPAAAASAPTDKPAEGGDIPEIADIPEMPMAPVAPVPQAGSDVPAWFTGLSAAIGLAACVVVGALAYYLYENAQLPTFCGGLGWGA